MTQAELNKTFKGIKLVFFRAGADTVTESTQRKAKAIFKEAIEFGDEINETFNRIGETLWIDSQSWIDYHK